MNSTELQTIADAHGFARLAFCSTEPFTQWLAAKANAHKTAQNLSGAPLDAAPWAKVLCIAATPYPLYRDENGVRVSAYYVNYNIVHARTQEFVDDINAHGVRAQALEIPIKPAAERAGLGVYGRNGLIRVHGLGSCVMLRCVALGAEFDTDGVTVHTADGDGIHPAGAECGSCRKCLDACPTGAVNENGFDFTRCLRAHMMQGPAAPEQFRAAMGGRLLGCEECLRACPHNALPVKNAQQPPEALRRVLDIGRLFDAQTRAEYVRGYGELLGYNYANANRILAQAILCAANLNMRQYEAEITRLKASPSPAVSAHAIWAEKVLNAINTENREE